MDLERGDISIEFTTGTLLTSFDMSVGISLTTLVLGVMLKPGGGRWTE
jgi:hypothetical protein